MNNEQYVDAINRANALVKQIKRVQDNALAVTQTADERSASNYTLIDLVQALETIIANDLKVKDLIQQLKSGDISYFELLAGLSVIYQGISE